MNITGISPSVIIVCAHHPEAQSTIDSLKLKRLPSAHAFPVFADQRHVLIESGQGATNVACAVGYIAGLITAATPAWLNLGIGGHAQYDIGTLMMAHRIVNNGNGESFYPLMGLLKDIPSATIRSFSEVNLDYRGDDIYDMEAWSFFAAASKFSTIEFIHSIKIVSDNAHTPASELVDKAARKQIAPLFQARQAIINNAIETLAQAIEQKAAAHSATLYAIQLQDKYHFSETQKIQLRQLLQQWQGVSANPINEIIDSNQFSNSRQLLEFLQQAYLQRCHQVFLSA